MYMHIYIAIAPTAAVDEAASLMPVLLAFYARPASPSRRVRRARISVYVYPYIQIYLHIYVYVCLDISI